MNPNQEKGTQPRTNKGSKVGKTRQIGPPCREGESEPTTYKTDELENKHHKTKGDEQTYNSERDEHGKG
jgi:hypothetical protein